MIGEHRAQRQRTRQDILAPRNPGNRLHLQRMQREQQRAGGNSQRPQRRRARAGNQAREDQQQQHGRNRVQRHIRQVERPRFAPTQREVEHIGGVNQRDVEVAVGVPPEGRDPGGTGRVEGPVLHDIDVIVPVGEPRPKRRRECHKHSDDEQRAECEICAADTRRHCRHAPKGGRVATPRCAASGALAVFAAPIPASRHCLHALRATMPRPAAARKCVQMPLVSPVQKKVRFGAHGFPCLRHPQTGPSPTIRRGAERAPIRIRPCAVPRDPAFLR